MYAQCRECGASISIATSCQEIFEKFLELEYSNPEYGAVHLLTVSCFMIQHGRYSDEALVWIEAALREHLDKGLPANKVREQMAREASPARRTWKVIRQPSAPALPKIDWSMTISDVAAKYHDVESYCDLVRQWGRKTLDEMKPLLLNGEAKEQSPA